MRLTRRSLLIVGVILALAIAVVTAYAIDLDPPWTQPQSSLVATPTELPTSPAATVVATPLPLRGADDCG